MNKDETIDRLYAALAEVEQIDLRGRRAGSPIHTAAVTVKVSILDALELLEDE